MGDFLIQVELYYDEQELDHWHLQVIFHALQIYGVVWRPHLMAWYDLPTGTYTYKSRYIDIRKLTENLKKIVEKLIEDQKKYPYEAFLTLYSVIVSELQTDEAGNPLVHGNLQKNTDTRRLPPSAAL